MMSIGSPSLHVSLHPYPVSVTTCLSSLPFPFRRMIYLSINVIRLTLVFACAINITGAFTPLRTVCHGLVG
jgi:hypothetical protein